MRPARDPWNGTGPLLVVAAWALAVVITTAAIVAGVTYTYSTIAAAMRRAG